MLNHILNKYYSTLNVKGVIAGTATLRNNGTFIHLSLILRSENPIFFVNNMKVINSSSAAEYPGVINLINNYYDTYLVCTNYKNVISRVSLEA